MKRHVKATMAPVQELTTEELVAELQRRALGCLLVSVRAEEQGDVWSYALKGSPILLGAMSAALQMSCRKSCRGGKQRRK